MAVLLASVFAAACGQTDRDGIATVEEPPPRNCEEATKLDRIRACLERHDGERFFGLASCLPFSEPQPLKGTWARDLEYSVIRAEPDQRLPAPAGEKWQRRSEVWLYMDANKRRALNPADDAPSLRQEFAIEVMGRRSLCPWYYGHTGAYPHAVIVEQLLSVRPLPPRE